MITALFGDITRLDFDLAVIGVNERFEPINEISSKVFERGGDALMEACQKLNRGRLGGAQISSAYNCPYKKLIHVVPPIYIDGNHKENDILKAVYWNSMVHAITYLEETKSDKISLAFSSLSVKGHRYPSLEAAQIAIDVIRSMNSKYKESKKIDVVFVCDNPEDYRSIKGELRKR